MEDLDFSENINRLQPPPPQKKIKSRIRACRNRGRGRSTRPDGRSIVLRCPRTTFLRRKTTERSRRIRIAVRPAAFESRSISVEYLSPFLNFERNE